MVTTEKLANENRRSMFTRLLTFENTGDEVCMSFEYLIVRASFGVQKRYSHTKIGDLTGLSCFTDSQTLESLDKWSI